MGIKRTGLGRNLSALLTERHENLLLTDEKPGSDALTLAIGRLMPGKYQPRVEIDDASLMELSESIKKQGLLQPLVVREAAEGRYEILAGERRWRACQLAGMSHVPVVVRQVDDETAMAIALVENLQRQDLNAMEQARAMHRLTTEFGLTHQQIADLLSKSRAAVSNFLRLLNLCAKVRHMLERNLLEMGHARCLLMLSEAEQLKVAQNIHDKQLSVRETEALVACIKNGNGKERSVSKKQTFVTPSLESALKTLSSQLKTKVLIKPEKTGGGALMIHFDDMDGLHQVVLQLME